ncbi:hypothetical protein [Kitasatospora sp. NPDC056184]|uniref:hypothetical protein n=1 Tax=Kitasatospora sp. NPDC056184 TaxID=3345738 RepID=UPI0035E1E3D1
MERATTGRTPDGRRTVDFHARQAVADGRVVELTYVDCRLRLGLIEQGEDFRDAGELGVRVRNHHWLSERKLRVHLAHLRAKLGPAWVESTARGHRLGRPRPPLPGAAEAAEAAGTAERRKHPGRTRP